MSIKFRISYSDRFLKNFVKLDPESQLIIREAVQILTREPLHPSLRTKRVQGTKAVSESSANMDLRITWQYQGEGIILARNCGYHDRALKNP